MAIQWDSKYATGVEAVDTQHRELFQLLDSLEHRLADGQPPALMMDIVHKLADYAKSHFAFEEKCMEEHACPSSAVNRLAHQRFLRAVEGRLKSTADRPPTRELIEDLHRELVDWVTSHICRIDTGLRNCHQRRAVG